MTALAATIHPTHCLHGNPIPGAAASATTPARPLGEVPAGESVEIVRGTESVELDLPVDVEQRGLPGVPGAGRQLTFV